VAGGSPGRHERSRLRRLNLVERFFRELTDKALRRGVFLSVPDLIAIEEYLDAHHAKGATFARTAIAEQLAKVARGRVALQEINQSLDTPLDPLMCRGSPRQR